MASNKMSDKPVLIAQFSDCHLLSNTDSLHHGANVYQHLQRVLHDIKKSAQFDAIIFTGDLTQDHTEQSYQHFVDCVKDAKLPCAVYFLAGNHDEPMLLKKYCDESQFNPSKCIDFEHWQIQLIDSKSKTPAGFVNSLELTRLQNQVDSHKAQLLLMHHHPVDVGYFIDRHGLQNKQTFWQSIHNIQGQQHPIKAIACGHVHRAISIEKFTGYAEQCVDVYTCPATSIAFNPSIDTVSSLDLPPSYRVFSLNKNGTLATNIKSL